jgi:hypothetical protein
MQELHEDESTVAPYEGSRCRSRNQEASNWNCSSVSASHKKGVEPLVHKNADNQPSLSVVITDGALKATQRSQFSGSNARRVGYIVTVSQTSKNQTGHQW